MRAPPYAEAITCDPILCEESARWESLAVDGAITAIARSGGCALEDLDDNTICLLVLRWVADQRRRSAIAQRRARLHALPGGRHSEQASPA